MIPHNFSFNGHGGRVQRLDAARNYSTPLTTPVDKDYSIPLDLQENSNVAAVSLDGRLWLFQKDDSLQFVALSWNKEKGQMQFARSLNFTGSSEVVLARGLDWILSNKNIFMVIDEEPFIKYAPLFDEAVPNTFLYSALRHGSVPLSGTDPFTKQAWGKRDDNGNSEGNAYFSRNTHLLYPAGSHNFEQCYSLLPAVGDWIIFENFLIRRPDNPLNEHSNYMLNLRPLIPLELLDRNAAFGTGYNFNHRGIQIAFLNGQLWGRGLYHIGRVFILPNTFTENGEPQGYYLYISTDFPNVNSALNANSSWLNAALASMGDGNPYGFIASEPMPITGGACFTSENSDILELHDGAVAAWLSLSQSNGRLFFDYSNQKAMLLDDERARIFLQGLNNDLDYQCYTLRQWLAPAGNVEAVNEKGVIASDDHSTFFTNFERGFHREVFSPCSLPLTAAAYEDKEEHSFRLSAVAHSNGLDFKHSLSTEALQTRSNWQDIYREPVKVDFINLINTPDMSYHQLPSHTPSQDGTYVAKRDYSFMLPLYYKMTHVSVLGIGDSLKEELAVYNIKHEVGPYDGIYDRVNIGLVGGAGVGVGVVLSCSADCWGIDPDTGEAFSFNLSIEFNPLYEVYSYYYRYNTRYSIRAHYHEVPEYVSCVDDKIGFLVTVYDRNSGNFPYTKLIFYPLIIKTTAHSIPFALMFSPQEDILHLISTFALKTLTAGNAFGFILPDNSSYFSDENGNLWANDTSIVFNIHFDLYKKTDDAYKRDDLTFFTLTVHVHYNNKEGLLL